MNAGTGGPAAGDAMAGGLLGTAAAILGGGCFWCLEAVYQQLKGVKEVTSGYAGGRTPNPTYRQVCGGGTGHAEVVRVVYDPSVISYRDILEAFFAIHDPTTPDRQGADTGPQYRSIILYGNDEEQRSARELIASLTAEGRWPDPIVTEVAPLGEFFPAEREHWDYYRRNPEQGYCRVVISPKVAKARKDLARLYQETA